MTSELAPIVVPILNTVVQLGGMAVLALFIVVVLPRRHPRLRPAPSAPVRTPALWWQLMVGVATLSSAAIAAATYLRT